MRIDLHTHSATSDGTDSPDELVAAAARAGVEWIALSDHDTFDGLPEATRAGVRYGVRVVHGLEFSAEHHGTPVHVLGYGCRVDDPVLGAELARVRQGRSGRMPAMLARLAAAGMPIDDVLAGIVGDRASVGRPHIADAMVAKGYVADRREAFDRYLAEGGPLFVGRYSTPLERALDLVQGAGGVAVVAHPWGRVSRAELPPELLAGLAEAGRLDGVEVDHQDHDASTRAELRALAARLGLLATGSSDYHGTGKQDHDLGCNTTQEEVLAAIAERVAGRDGRLLG